MMCGVDYQQHCHTSYNYSSHQPLHYLQTSVLLVSHPIIYSQLAVLTVSAFGAGSSLLVSHPIIYSQLAVLTVSMLLELVLLCLS